MKKILITGADGQLGREIRRQLNIINEAEVIITNEKELDICIYESVEKYIKNIKPDIVINCAAFTAVELCETEEEKAYEVNGLGAGNLALAAKKVEAVIVQVSTDYVFDGTADKPYVETDRTNPVSAYGRTKLAGEEFVKKYNEKHFIVRTAWLYGEGKNFVKTMLGLSETNTEVRVVADQIGTPTSTKELSKLIIRLIETECYGIYHGTCEGSTTWYEFAAEIFRLAGRNMKVIPINTFEYKSMVKRPKYSVLENKKYNELFNIPLNSWEKALKEYMEEIL